MYLKPQNEKLYNRSLMIISEALKISIDEAKELLRKADGNVEMCLKSNRTER